MWDTDDKWRDNGEEEEENDEEDRSLLNNGSRRGRDRDYLVEDDRDPSWVIRNRTESNEN